MIGSEFGRYKIVERVGAGGMGEVYRAEDTTLGRPVALKFLAAHLLNDDEAKQRFLREARAAAAVRHPNICHVYEVGEENGKTFLAMDYLEGESLEDRIAKGPLPLKDALDIGRQIAEGLEAAHEKGIVHRDIKPANVMVDAKGRATILDFGLARLTEASKLTRPDQTVGTAAYMSPEQIQGADVDHRTDIWALGCVLYEMVAGLRPFKGQYDQALAYEIVNQQPEHLTGVRAGLPIELEVFVGKCLAKDPGERYQNAQDLSVDLRSLAKKLDSSGSRVLSVGPQPATPTPVAGGVKPAWRWVALATGVVALVGWVGFLIQPAEKPQELPLRTFSFTPPDFDPRGAARISPDGRMIVYTAGAPQSLWIQDLSAEEPRKLDGTVGARRQTWSPDSRTIAFLAEGELRTIPAAGGIPSKVCDVRGEPNGYYSVIWSNRTDEILFSVGPPLRLFGVAESGGEPRAIVANMENEQVEELFVSGVLPAASGFNGAIVGLRFAGGTPELSVIDTETGEAVADLGVAGVDAVYSPSGHIVYSNVQTGIVWALPVSLKPFRVEGRPFPLDQNQSHVSVADDSTLVMTRVSLGESSGLSWLNRSGEVLNTLFEGNLHPNRYAAVRLSPDGSRVAVRSARGGELLIADLPTGAVMPVEGEFRGLAQAAWSPDGQSIAYSAAVEADFELFQQKVGDPGSAEKLRASPPAFMNDWSRDGRYIFYHHIDTATGRDLYYLEKGPGGAFGEPVQLFASKDDELNGRLSPDGSLLAYVKTESGAPHVYVTSFPDIGFQRKVSTVSGQQPRWSSSGDELFYVEADTLMVVAVEGHMFSPPRKLFSNPALTQPSAGMTRYDVSPDGQRFIMLSMPKGEDQAVGTIRVWQNWYERFRKAQE